MPDEKTLFQQATQHFRNKEFDQAVKVFQQSIHIKPTEEAFCGLGLVYAFQNRFDEAQKTFQEALRLNPKSTTAQSALQKVKQQIEESEKIVQFYKQQKLVEHEKKQPLTSLIVITYNQLYYTQLCLESIFATTDAPYELILVDNASTDGTGGYFLSLEKNKQKLSPCLKGLYLCLNPQNKGFAAAANQGLKQAKGQVVGVLNNDLLFTPGWLSLLLEQMQKNSCPIIGPVCNAVPDLVQLPQLVSLPYTDVSSLLSYLPTANKNISFSPTEWVAGFCMLIQRGVIQKIGYFDEHFGLGFCEDEDYCYRARHAGFSVGYATVFVHHYWHKSFSQLDANKQNDRVMQNLVYLLQKMIRLNPKDAQAHYRLADHFTLLGDLPHAEEHYKACLQSQPDHADALYNLGVLYQRTDRLPMAKELFQKLLKLQPNHAGAKKALAHVT